jgi:hypothetical protein
MNESFIFQQIRKYNSAQRQSLKDAALTAVGIHAGLLVKSRIVMRELTPEERNRVLCFLRQFVQGQGLEISIE